MKLHFFKYQGAGNDFIMVDNRDHKIKHQNPSFIAKLCDRRFGIGGDGIMFLELAEGYDFKMVYYNADGQPSSMCGNGGRCIVAFAKQLGVIKNKTTFLAVDGPHSAEISTDTDWVSLEMIDVKNIDKDGEAFVLNTGSPHYVKFDVDVAEKDVFAEGKAIRNSSDYKKEGINVNFVEDKKDYLFVRTYERGVENETYACGTGVTAVALANAISKNLKGNNQTAIRVLGGDLNIKYHYDGDVFTDIYLEGPAKLVFEGEIEVGFK
ncbi:diaminopimelate epimerase [Pedobacter sp. SD-b]|uniref:Diaminopimelate epimerase n=1 Tax=Pedobacter segetis TaxID=2793069 RepID=A0ABS1BND7_9SPHI|nr:diaminopimelate epimerase [Pedobacter segetis]MBK0384376.1 diaminopimelate epimerase [Pedobacter segetis]